MSLLSRIYERINWKDEPIEETPLSARNLNKIDFTFLERARICSFISNAMLSDNVESFSPI